MPGRSTSITASKLYTVELGQHRCIEILRELLKKTDERGKALVQHDPKLGCALYVGKVSLDGSMERVRSAEYGDRS